MTEKAPAPASQTEKATFAGGCFWCMEPPFDKVDGILKTTVGYMGGDTDNPTYEEICQGTTGHAEVIQVEYDPSRVGYDQLLEVFWRNINPTTKDRQFYDSGTQYRTAIFYHSDDQRQAAEASRKKLETSGKFNSPIVTEITGATAFYAGEEYHQDYYKKKPDHYKRYRTGSGRDAYLKETWGE